MNIKRIPVEDDDYTYGWGVAHVNDDCGRWMYVKGLDFYNKPFEHWNFFELRDCLQYEEDQEAFFKRYRGIKEVVMVHPEPAWRHDKHPILIRL